MTVRTTLAVVVLASYLLPTAVSAAIVQKWHSSGSPAYGWVPQISGDITGTGVYDMVTVETSGAAFKIGIRSGSTGALLTQTTGTYASPSNFLLADVDGNGATEILFTAGNTNIVCLNFSGVALTERFNYAPTAAGFPSQWAFADLDGNGHQYLVFRDESLPGYQIRDYNGALVTTIVPATPGGTIQSKQLIIDDFDADGRQEIMVDYLVQNQGDYLYVYESNAPGPARPAAVHAPAYHNPTLESHKGPFATPSNSGRADRHAGPVVVGGSR